MLNFIKKRILHDLLGWGFVKRLDEDDGFQPTYYCRFCDGKITRDSTGAWFHLSDY